MKTIFFELDFVHSSKEMSPHILFSRVLFLQKTIGGHDKKLFRLRDVIYSVHTMYIVHANNSAKSKLYEIIINHMNN